MKFCKHCGLPLIKSIYSEDHRYKSCPKCSSINGEEHVFLPYPEKFGNTHLRETIANPDGAQSYCISHRSNPDEHISNCSVVCSKLEDL